MTKPTNLVHFTLSGHQSRPTAFVSPETGRRMSLAMTRYRLSQSDLSAILGLVEKPSSDVFQARLGEMLEIVESVRGWASTDKEALDWYLNTAIPAFDGRTPADLVRNGMALTVKDYVDHLAYGGYA